MNKKNFLLAKAWLTGASMVCLFVSLARANQCKRRVGGLADTETLAIGTTFRSDPDRLVRVLSGGGDEMKGYLNELVGSKRAWKTDSSIDPMELSRAIETGDAAAVRKLVRRGADVNKRYTIPGWYNETNPVAVAMEKGNDAILQILIEEGGADIFAGKATVKPDWDTGGYRSWEVTHTAYELASPKNKDYILGRLGKALENIGREGTSKEHLALLLAAIDQDDAATVGHIIRRADIAPPAFQKALAWAWNRAVLQGDKAMVKALAETGVQPTEAVFELGSGFLNELAGSKPATRFDPTLDPKALISAIKNEDLAEVRALIRQGVDVNKLSEFHGGITEMNAVAAAVKQGNEAILEVLLEEGGADIFSGVAYKELDLSGNMIARDQKLTAWKTASPAIKRYVRDRIHQSVARISHPTPE